MLAKLLKGNQNFIPIMIFVLWAIGFYFLNLIDVNAVEPFVSAGLLAAVVVIIAIIINGLIFFKNNNFFTFLWAFSFLILACCFRDLAFFSAFFFLYLMMAHLIYAAERSDVLIFNTFDMGFYIGIAIILHPPFWIFGILFIIHYITLGKGHIRNLFFYVLGLLALTVLCIEIIAILDIWELMDTFLVQLWFKPYVFQLSDLFLIPLLIFAVLGMVDYFRNLNRQSVAKKAIFFDGMLWFVCAIVYGALYGMNNTHAFILILMPICLFISNFLTFSKTNWHQEVVLLGFVLSLLLYRFHHLIVFPEFFDSITF